MAAHKFREIPISKWGDYVALIDGLKSWAFRGQADARWPILSSLGRRFQQAGIQQALWPQQETRTLRIFKRKAHQFLHHVPPDDDDFEWLSVMQHHGAPTRLIDFTWSPYVAAYFALDTATTNAVVWAIHPAAVLKGRWPRIRGGKAADLSLRTPGTLDRYFFRNRHKFATYGEPATMTTRLTQQQGTFFCPADVSEPLENLLAAGTPEPEWVTKIIIDASKVRIDAMFALYNMNITAASLFPGLDGLARSMAYELEFHWAVDVRSGVGVPHFDADPYAEDLDTHLRPTPRRR